MAGGGGAHNKSPRWGSGLLGGGWGVGFADWNAPSLGGILDQQGVGNVGNSTMYQLRRTAANSINQSYGIIFEVWIHFLDPVMYSTCILHM